MAELDKVFKAGVSNKASDIHISPGEPFILRRFGKLIKLKSKPLTADLSGRLILELLNEDQRKVLERDLQLDFSYEIENLGRFRGSAMMHQNGMSAAFRIIPPSIPTLESLGLPETATKVLDHHQGLILVTGATGQGKTTTLASMVNYINGNRAHHVLTVEDPVEFVHPLKKGVVNQRQIGNDTLSYGNSLKAALREDPDVIMIGELRDLETISLAIAAAETGHLVLGTLSTTNAPKTVDRVIDSFPPGDQAQIRNTLSETLQAVITQRLIPGINNDKMELAYEILVGTAPVASLIRDGKVFQIPNQMRTGKKLGMCLMDESLLQLAKEERISVEDAVQVAEDPAAIRQAAGGPQQKATAGGDGGTTEPSTRKKS
ncbi:MAG: type IV pilus twitching motility protein PilT [Desulfarculaceae bacterium]|nr:type IV pilus twitching motility protein PilT [Desulfarculaceae bacterium]